MARLETKVRDRRLFTLIHRMLKAKVVMPDGVVVSTDEGTFRKAVRCRRCSVISCWTNSTASLTGAATASCATPTTRTSTSEANARGIG